MVASMDAEMRMGSEAWNVSAKYTRHVCMRENERDRQTDRQRQREMRMGSEAWNVSAKYTRHVCMRENERQTDRQTDRDEDGF